MGRKAYETFVCSCGERCVMVPHEKSGKLAPITMALYDGGNIEMVWGSTAGSDVYRIVPKFEREDGRLLRFNHFSNCPDADRFRK